MNEFPFHFIREIIFSYDDNLSMPVHVFPMRTLSSFSVKEIFFLRCVKWSTNFTGFPLEVEIGPSYLKHTCSVLFASM